VRVQFNFPPRSDLTQAPHYQEAVPLPWLKDEKLLATPMPAEWGEDRLKEARTIMVKFCGLSCSSSVKYFFNQFLKKVNLKDSFRF